MKKEILMMFGVLVFSLTLLFAGGFGFAEELINGEETEEEIEEVEEEVEALEENQNRLGRMKEVISSLIDGLDEDAPQREALQTVLERAESIGERIRERMQETQARLEQARERRELAEQHQRLTRMRTTIEGLMDNAEEGAKSALQTVLERAETVQNRIRERFNQ